MQSSKKINKSDLIELVSKQTKIYSGDIREVLECVLNTIVDECAKGERVVIKNFGSFEKSYRKGRRVKNPRTLEWMEYSAYEKLKFTASPKVIVGQNNG